MNYGLEELLLWNILRFLEVNVTSKDLMRILGNLMLDLMKVYFLDILLPKRHKDATILDYIVLLRVLMLDYLKTNKFKHQETIPDDEDEDDDELVDTQTYVEEKDDTQEDEIDTRKEEEDTWEEEIIEESLGRDTKHPQE